MNLHIKYADFGRVILWSFVQQAESGTKPKRVYGFTFGSYNCAP